MNAGHGASIFCRCFPRRWLFTDLTTCRAARGVSNERGTRELRFPAERQREPGSSATRHAASLVPAESLAPGSRVFVALAQARSLHLPGTRKAAFPGRALARAGTQCHTAR